MSFNWMNIFQNLFYSKATYKNMNKRILYISFLLFCFGLSTVAQVDMGKWRTHFAYNNVTQITQSANKIYAISEGALFSVDKSDGTMEFYSKLNGLSSSDISNIEYDAVDQALLIIYTNGNIDVMSADGISNIPDFYNKQITASKNINHIQFYLHKAYLSCNFGIIVLDMKKKEVADTYYIGPNASEVKVINTTINNGNIYALTSSTVFQASISNPNLVNYALWTALSNFPGSGDFQKLIAFSGQLILLRGGKLFKQNIDNTWTALIPTVNISAFNVSNNSLNAFDGNSAYLFDNTFNINTVNNIGVISDAEYDITNNAYWFAANASGIISYKQTANETPTINYYKPDGPAVNTPWDMTFSSQKLFVVPGGRWDIQYNNLGNVMMFENGIWSNILTPSIQSKTGKQALDFMNVAVDQADNKHFFVTSYGTGLYEFRNNSFYRLYNESNSTIKSIFPGDPLYMRLDGAVLDTKNNLYLTNSNEKNGVVVRMADSTWTQLNYPGVDNKPTLGKILISNQNQNQKWVTSVRFNPGICVFDDNGTIKDQSDDKSVFFQTFTIPEIGDNGQTKYSSYSPTAIFTVAQDKNGVIWVGTDMGPFLFNNLESVYNPNYLCSRVKIPRNDSTNAADYLLANESVQAIAIDGANRKWIGTKSSGAYLMSENGQQTIHQFTATNSPLLSNNILSIAINPGTGEVFFGTDKGIVSYQSDAKEAGTTFNNVYAYPNPVRQGYTGLITITGLIEKTQVKITDIKGNLICETVSNGSYATWDGKDVHGKRVNTGIYLAICVNADGTQSTITKIMVIN